MSARKDFYFRQRVTEAELDAAFDDLEQADHDLAADLGFVGVLANAVVSPHAPVPNLTVDVSGPGSVLDQQGQRIFFSSLQNVNVAQDDNGVSTEVSAAGKEKIVSVFVKFDRALSDPRIDGNSLTVFFRRDESFKFSIAQGAEAAAGAAVPPSAVRTNAANVFSATQTVNGTADETNAALATTSAPITRKLLWQIAGVAGIYNYRLYAASRTFELTLNAQWNGEQWVKDTTTLASAKLELNNFELRVSSDDAQLSPFADAWPSSIGIPVAGHGQQSLDAGGNWTSPGPTETYIAWQGVSGANIGRAGAGASFRKAFPATPSSITFVLLDGANIASGPFVHAPTAHGTGAQVNAAQGSVDTHFYARVIAS